MRAGWLSLALVCGLFGCASSHEDGDRMLEPPTCDVPSGIGGVILGLTCPVGVVPPGEVVVGVTSRPDACCDEAAGVPRAIGGLGGSFTIAVAWSGCGCCLDHCGCTPMAEPTQTDSVSLGMLGPGLYTVEAGTGPTTQRCEINVAAPPSMCERRAAEEVRMPRVIFEDQSLAVTGRSTMGVGCGCTPQLAAPMSGSPEVALELCGCCEACECVDPGYEASRDFGLYPLGDHTVVVPAGVLPEPLSVRTRAQCHEVDATAVTVVGPDDSLRVSGPRLWWARVEGEEALCCAAPLPAVEEIRGAPTVKRLLLWSCVEADCDCIPGAPTPFVAWHSLGELAPGEYVVDVDGARTVFEVP